MTETLQDEADRLGDELNDAQDEADGEERGAAIEARLAEIDALQSVWTDEIKAGAGAVIYLGFGGAVEIERGLIRPEDVTADEPEDEPQGSGKGGDTAKAPALPASLVEELTAQKTAALRDRTGAVPRCCTGFDGSQHGDGRFLPPRRRCAESLNHHPQPAHLSSGTTTNAPPCRR